MSLGHVAIGKSTEGYTVEDTPGWVASATSSAEASVNEQQYRDGVVYLLVDRQWHVTDSNQSQYSHFQEKALNPSGVTEISRVSIDFDPSYQKLVLHKLVLHRDGEVLDRRQRSLISLIHREQNLDVQIYDGSKTLNILIEDVRVGDVLEYSYSIEGANPVLDGHFSKHLGLRWSVPVKNLHYRVLWNSHRPLRVSNYQTDLQPKINALALGKEYVWQRQNVTALVLEKDTPSWYDPFPELHLSDYQNWKEVIDWALPLYQVSTSAKQNKILSELNIADEANKETQLLSALKFVQDDVRYLGIEMGERSHKPNEPDKVLEQRFGDCKDKARLLVSLLRAMNIDASVALVNTNSGRFVERGLPSPTVFDHAIVFVQLQGKNYWLDATRSYQQGTLSSLYMPDYEVALIIAPQRSELADMSKDVRAVHKKEVEEYFNVSGNPDKPSTYLSKTRHERYYADVLRSDLAKSNLAEVQKGYLDYLANIYPKIRVDKKLRIEEDAVNNAVTVIEKYLIPDIWIRNDDNETAQAGFEPFLIQDHVKQVSTLQRTMPYAVLHPVEFNQTTRILVPAASSFENEFVEVRDSAFHFTKTVDFSRRQLVISYHYKSLQDHVEASEIAVHAQHVKEVLEQSGYYMELQLGLLDVLFDHGKVNWDAVTKGMKAIGLDRLQPQP